MKEIDSTIFYTQNFTYAAIDAPKETFVRSDTRVINIYWTDPDSALLELLVQIDVHGSIMATDAIDAWLLINNYQTSSYSTEEL